ncbi:protein BIG GRAIN 1-like B [Apium graveolens]|uniref:protein BIG GRAIN 1-like B n=1 Tax=Apium graveolens TaxID=4045 RepID=UPI003D798768
MSGYPPRRKLPSFSSSLLDSIYRSIDEPECNEELYRTKQEVDHQVEVVPSLRPAIMIEKWMEDGRSKNEISSKHTFKNLNGSNSSDSSCCGTMFSSSDNESATRSRQKSSFSHIMQTPKREMKFITTTKSRALQIYSELKKVKQPISPGGRIASILNSIFSSKTMKKSKFNEDVGSVTKSRSLHETTNTSASSFSRTCLRKTPSSKCKMNSNGMRRAVRFSPVSVNIVDEDCERETVYKDDPTIVSFPIVRNLDKKIYNAANGDVINYGGIVHKNDHRDCEDDIASCSSSDLFELDNIGAAGIGLYAEELPVYGTTNLKTNKAIAKGYVF